MITPATLPQLHTCNRALDMSPEKLGSLRDSSDAAEDVVELGHRFEADGYSFLRAYLNCVDVIDARAALADRLAAANRCEPAFSRDQAVGRRDFGCGVQPDLPT